MKEEWAQGVEIMEFYLLGEWESGQDECFKGSEEEREGDFLWRGHSGERVYSEKPKRKQGDEKVRKGRVRSS